MGNPTTFVALDGSPGSFPPAYNWSVPTVKQATAACHERMPDAVWAQVARQARKSGFLRLAVIGSSITAGTGAGSMRYSWGRHLHDTVRALVQPQMGVEVTTSIFGKNAVDPSYMTHCTDEIVPSDADVVIFEVGANLYRADQKGNTTGLEALVQAVRQVAPHAVGMFAVWLKRDWIPDSLTGTKVTMASEAMHLDFVRAHEALCDDGCAAYLRGQRRSCTHRSECNRPLLTYYHKHGTDHHPSQIGHRLLAELVARHIAGRILRARRHQGVASLVVEETAPVLTTVDRIKEICYTRADRIPIHPTTETSSTDWKLVDEGATTGTEGTVKLGWVSRRIGDHLDVGPLPWGAWRARVGYLVSTHAGMGAIGLSCLGSACYCERIDFFAAKNVLPFPVVQTDAWLTRDIFAYDLSEGNLSVTVTTKFAVRWRTTWTTKPPVQNSSSGCFLRLTHLESRRPRTNSSRVRFDSLTLQLKSTPVPSPRARHKG